MMKKITDERLKLQNLKNIRVLFIVQSIGMIGILAYNLVTKGMDSMTANPLWFVFIITAIVAAYLSMSITVDHESDKKSSNKGLIISLIVITLISIVVGVLVSMSEGYGPINGIITGGVLFICSLAPILFIYYLRTKRQNKN